MPIVTFDVESYTVVTSQSGAASTAGWRKLSLTSPDLSHGIRNRASLFFFQQGPASNRLGVVTNVDQPNYIELSAYAYLWKPDFAEWYDILRNEAPLRCGFGYAGPDFDASQPSRQLWWIQLFTGQPQPPGEGPEELQAKTFPAHVLEVLNQGRG